VSQVPPVHFTGKYYLLHILAGGMFFIAVTEQEAPPVQVFAVLKARSCEIGG